MKSFLQFLLEMPLARYSVASFTRKPDSTGAFAADTFAARDRKAVHSSVIQNKLAQVLQTSTGYNFNIIFLERGLGYQDDSEVDYVKSVQRYCLEQGIVLPGHITFAKNSSSGDPLSPWMILHTVGHALGNFDKQLFSSINNILTNLYLEQGFGRSARFTTKVSAYMCQFFQFKSAKKEAVLGLEELIYDLVAEYLWHGFIRWKLPEGIYIKNFGESVKEIEQIIHNSLGSAVGQIIVDFF